MTQLPTIGKISPAVFESLIYSRLGYPRDDVLVGPQSGVDVSIVELPGGAVLAATCDPGLHRPSVRLSPRRLVCRAHPGFRRRHVGPDPRLSGDRPQPATVDHGGRTHRTVGRRPRDLPAARHRHRLGPHGPLRGLRLPHGGRRHCVGGGRSGPLRDREHGPPRRCPHLHQRRSDRGDGAVWRDLPGGAGRPHRSRACRRRRAPLRTDDRGRGCPHRLSPTG